jgi:hypothetical protein
MLELEQRIVNIYAILAFGIVAAAGTAFWCQKTKEKKIWRKVGKVDQLWNYPLKSGKGISVTSGDFCKMGLRSGPFKDRIFAVIHSG